MNFKLFTFSNIEQFLPRALEAICEKIFDTSRGDNFQRLEEHNSA